MPTWWQMFNRLSGIQRSVKSGDQKSEYIGLVSTTFKTRYNNLNLISSFKNSYTAESSTGLSKHVWSLKRDNKLFEIKRSIHSIGNPNQKEPNKCHLCLTEKTLIILAERNLSWNKKTWNYFKMSVLKKMLLVNVVWKSMFFFN